MTEKCVWDDLVKRDGLFYKKFTDVPFTGEVTGKEQGLIQDRIFRDGKEVGARVTYYKNGQLKNKGTYKDGKEDGPWVEYYDNGQLWIKGTYKDGKEDGPWVGYHDNGQLSYKGTYKDGERDGPWVGYDEDGTVVGWKTGTFKDGEKID